MQLLSGKEAIAQCVLDLLMKNYGETYLMILLYSPLSHNCLKTILFQHVVLGQKWFLWVSIDVVVLHKLQLQIHIKQSDSWIGRV